MTRAPMLAQPPVLFARSTIKDVPRLPVGQPHIIVRGAQGIDLTTLLDTAVCAGTNFGPAAVNGESVTRTFAIDNSGTAALCILGVGVEGTDADQFSVCALPDPVVPVGLATNLSVCFSALREGPAFALVMISSNSPEECPYMFLVEGLGKIG